MRPLTYRECVESIAETVEHGTGKLGHSSAQAIEFAYVEHELRIDFGPAGAAMVLVAIATRAIREASLTYSAAMRSLLQLSGAQPIRRSWALH